MNFGYEWWAANWVCGDGNKEGAVKIKGQYLTTVSYVKVSSPPAPGRDNTCCFIHGQISFNCGNSGDPVTLFLRERDKPDQVDLADVEEGCFLTLSDGHEGERPLGEITDSIPLCVNMKLYEKISEEEEDVLIADVTNFEDYNVDRDRDLCCHFRVEGKAGFSCQVCYTVVFGARAEVKVKMLDHLRMNKEEGGSTREIPMWGNIEALQCLRTYFRADGTSNTTLIHLYDKEAVICKADEFIKLERKFVVVPMRYKRFLSIAITVVVTDHESQGEGAPIYSKFFDFPLGKVREDWFITNKNLTHTKLKENVSGTVFSYERLS